LRTGSSGPIVARVASWYPLPAQRESSITITGGGTAGHVFPALAIADALIAIGYTKDRIGFVGSRRGMEGRLVLDAGYAIWLLPGRGISRRLSLANLWAVLGLLAATLRSIARMTRMRPSVVVSVGGYAAVPCSIAAVILNVPIVVVNVDAAAGLANRLIARFARLSAVGFASTPLPRAVVTGAPVRDEIEAVTRGLGERLQARRLLGVPEQAKLVAIVGGSLGAGRLNELGLVLAKALEFREDVVIYHVVGERNYAQMLDRVALSPSGPHYRCVAFATAMDSLLSAADLMVCRAGAMTVAELAITGTPAILLPIANSPNDHQRKNAESLALGGGAKLLDNETPHDAFVQCVIDLVDDRARLGAMSEAARRVGHRGAARVIAGLVDNVVRRKPPGELLK